MAVLLLKSGRLEEELKQITMIDNFSILAQYVFGDTVFYKMSSIFCRTARVNKYSKSINLLWKHATPNTVI